MASINIESDKHNMEKQTDTPNIDIELDDGIYILKIEPNHVSETMLNKLKQAIFDAFKPKPRKPRKKITNADMTPEQILMKKANRLKWYRANKEHVKNYIKKRYNTDYEFWKNKKKQIMKEKNIEWLTKMWRTKKEDRNLKIQYHLRLRQTMMKVLK